MLAGAPGDGAGRVAEYGGGSCEEVTGAVHRRTGDGLPGVQLGVQLVFLSYIVVLRTVSLLKHEYTS